MSNNFLRVRHNVVVRGSVVLVLLSALLILVSTSAFACMQGNQARTAASLANAPAGGAGPAGTADLQWDPQTKVLTVVVSIHGFPSGRSYANHIHAGTCSTGGDLLYPLDNLVTDTSGDATTTTMVADISGGIPASGWNIMVHSGPTSSASGLLCGNVMNPDGATELSVPLDLVGAMP